MKIKLINQFESYRDEVFTIELENSTKINKFESEFDNLEVGIGVSKALKFPLNHKNLANTYSLQIAKPSIFWQKVLINDFKNALNSHPKNNGLAIFLGNDIDKKPYFLTLNNALPHLIIGGTTGGGKSTLLQAMILYLLKTSNAEILAIDPKNNGDFDMFNERAKIIIGKDEIQNELENLALMVDERNQISKQNPSALNPLVIVVDELADLVTQSENLKNIEKIARMGRSAKMHLLLCTQTVKKTTFSSDLLNNILGRIALKLPDKDSLASRLILGEKGAESLQGNGDMIVKQNGILERVFGVYLTKDEIINLLKA